MGVRRLAVVNGPNIVQMLLVGQPIYTQSTGTISLKLSWFDLIHSK